MQSLKSFLIEAEAAARTSRSSKAVGDNAEVEAATILRSILPHHLTISRGTGRTHEGGVAPDLVIHGDHHITHDEHGQARIKHPTMVAHALLTKKGKKWSFTVVAHKHVHKEVAAHAPEVSHGVRMFVRKRPAGTNKDPKSSNFGKADVQHSVYFKPTGSDSIPSTTFHEHGDFTTGGHALAAAISKHVQEYGPFVIDIKAGGSSQLNNISFQAQRESHEHAPKVSFEGSSLPHETGKKFSEHLERTAGHHISHYFNKLGMLVGRAVNSTKIRKYRSAINGTKIHPRDDLDIPEAHLAKVPFHHEVGNEHEAAEGVRLSFERTASGYGVAKHG